MCITAPPPFIPMTSSSSPTDEKMYSISTSSTNYEETSNIIDMNNFSLSANANNQHLLSRDAQESNKFGNNGSDCNNAKVNEY